MSLWWHWGRIRSIRVRGWWKMPLDPRKIQSEQGGGVWSSGRSGWTLRLRRNESITFIPQRCWESNLPTPEEVKSWEPQIQPGHLGLPTDLTLPRAPEASPVASSTTDTCVWNLLANSIFASLGSSVEIKGYLQ